MRAFFTILILCVGWSGFAKALAPGASACVEAADAIQAELGLPRALLHAIAVTESGRWLKGTGDTVPWPWTIRVDGRSHYLDDRKAAVKKLETLHAAGHRSIDVGCMQINLRYHPEAFETLAQALDPHANIRYAASFLLELKAETRSWARSIGAYHSRTPKKSMAYRLRVQRLWNSQRVDWIRRQRAAIEQVNLETRRRRSPANTLTKAGEIGLW
ncbi:MAG: lytic transglycosylase domain-containing protein [Geminicoccaceae bacterium]